MFRCGWLFEKWALAEQRFLLSRTRKFATVTITIISITTTAATATTTTATTTTTTTTTTTGLPNREKSKKYLLLTVYTPFVPPKVVEIDRQIDKQTDR